MGTLRFSRLIVIEYGRVGQLRHIGSVREAAECLLGKWPNEGRGPKFSQALEACHNALAGDGSAESARRAFIAAAKEADIFVREAGPRG
jgi:hypothetical protein